MRDPVTGFDYIRMLGWNDVHPRNKLLLSRDWQFSPLPVRCCVGDIQRVPPLLLQ